MAPVPYIGSGPYCFSNSLAMMTGDHDSSVIQFATCSPFGMQTFGPMVFFDPYGWEPLQGIAMALEAMGWEAREIIGKDEADARENLTRELAKGPVFVGPVELGWLSYNPIFNGPIESDHYVVVNRLLDNGMLEVHDPQGFPYATIPVDQFMKAWKADTIPYGQGWTMRTDFKRVAKYTEEEVIKRSIKNAVACLSGDKGAEMPPGSKMNGDATQILATRIKEDFNGPLKGLLTMFAIRSGARSAADGATCLSKVGYHEAAKLMETQARLIGSLQYTLTRGDKGDAIKVLGELEGVYGKLKTELEVRLAEQ